MRNMTYSIEYLLNRIREYRLTSGLSKNGLAVLANIPEGCVRAIDENNWNPTTVTIARLEKVIPPDFTPEAAAASTKPTNKVKGKRT